MGWILSRRSSRYQDPKGGRSGAHWQVFRPSVVPGRDTESTEVLPTPCTSLTRFHPFFSSRAQFCYGKKKEKNRQCSSLSLTRISQQAFALLDCWSELNFAGPKNGRFPILQVLLMWYVRLELTISVNYYKGSSRHLHLTYDLAQILQNKGLWIRAPPFCLSPKDILGSHLGNISLDLGTTTSSISLKFYPSVLEELRYFFHHEQSICSFGIG